MQNIQQLFKYIPYTIDGNLNKQGAKVWYKSEILTKKDEIGNSIPVLRVGDDNFNDVPAAYFDLSKFVSIYMNAESVSEAEQIKKEIAYTLLNTITLKANYIETVENHTKNRDEQSEIDKDAKLIYNTLEKFFINSGIILTDKFLYHTEYGSVAAMDFYETPSSAYSNCRLTIHFDSATPCHNAQIRLRNILFSEKYRGKGFSKKIINLLFSICENSGHQISLFIEEIVNTSWEEYLRTNGSPVVGTSRLGNTVRIKNYLP